MEKEFIIIANQFHAGHNLFLREMILAQIYESMGEGIIGLKNSKKKGSLILACPLWFLQLWLNASFEDFLSYLNPIDAESGEIKASKFTGILLALLIPSEEVRNLQ